MKKKQIGKVGENIACKYIKQKGYQILYTNYSTKTGEIDIISKKDGIIVLFEVKTRTTMEKGAPYEAISPLKLKRLKRSIKYFLSTNKKYLQNKLRLDVIGIILTKEGNLVKLRHYQNVDI